MISGREISLEIIMGVLEEHGFYKDEYNSAVEKYDPDDRERRFVSNLSSGTIERCIELDYIIDIYSAKPSAKLRPYIRNILRMSIYQLKYMDRVPESAVVNEAVKLTRKKGHSGLSGFVNGVLRNIIRKPDMIVYPDKKKAYKEYLKVKYSMPEWLVKHFSSEMNDGEIETAFEYFLNNKKINIRTVADDIGISGAKAGMIFKDSLKISGMGCVETIPGYKEGKFIVQDESSMIPSHIINEYITRQGNNNRLDILDVCASPGGKTLLLAGLLKERADFTACDISDAKTGIIAENAKRLGIRNIKVMVRDALIQYSADRERYDVVIADLPCSGLGVIAKKPDIKYNTKPEDLEELAKIQKKMLSNAAGYVKKGGLLSFSTCTVCKKENEDNTAWFLDNFSDFEKVDSSLYVPDILKNAVEDGCVRVLPGKYESDGFYVSVFRKKNDTDTVQGKKYKDMLSFTYDELVKYMEESDYPQFRAKQLYEWLHKKLASDWDELSNIPKELRGKLAGDYLINPLQIKDKVVSKTDGTAKYIMETWDGGIIESVAMNHDYGFSICVSSQIGCRMGCRFCASTILGLQRSLTASEILAQIYNISRDMGRRVDNIVIMGIGEPFDNYDEVVKFMKMISDENGQNISMRSLTVSTCGLVDKIYRFADENMPVTLAISLHAPNDEIRKTIMPVAKSYKIDEIMKACNYYIKKTGRRVTFEYTMIDGVNDTIVCADELAKRLGNMLCHVNLIPLNKIKEKKARSSEASKINAFQKQLEKNRINVTIRKGMGKDIEAACGQLRRKYVNRQLRE